MYLIDTPDSHSQIFSPQSRISQQYWIMTYCMFTILQIHVIVSYKINYNRWIKWAAASNSIENIVCWWKFFTIYIYLRHLLHWMLLPRFSYTFNQIDYKLTNWQRIQYFYRCNMHKIICMVPLIFPTTFGENKMKVGFIPRRLALPQAKMFRYYLL